MRLFTWLAPSIPLEFYRALAGQLSNALGAEVSVTSITSASGPAPRGHEPFSSGEADLGALCGPTLGWLLARTPPAVTLLAAPVPKDSHAAGRPVYFADLVVRRDSTVRSVEDLRASRLAYNDRRSQSGWFSVLGRVGDVEFFSSCERTGSHAHSIEAVRRGEADVAAIDSTATLDRKGLRTVERLGPFAIQPIVARAGLAPGIVDEVARTLTTLHSSPSGQRCLELAGYLRFVTADQQAYRSATGDGLPADVG